MRSTHSAPSGRSGPPARGRRPSRRRHRLRRWSLVAFALTVVMGALRAFTADAEPSVNVLRVEQVVSGIPGGRAGESTRSAYQQLVVDPAGQRLVLKEYDRVKKPEGDGFTAGRLQAHYILRSDQEPPVIYKISSDGSQYREYEGDLTKQQKNRLYHEFEIIEFTKTLPAKERDKILKDHYLRADGTRDIKVERGEEQRVLDYPCRRLVVTENGREIINAYLTEEVGGARSFFHLYRRLGAFSDEVLDKIRDIRGLPLKGKITVVTELPVYRMSIEVKKVEKATVSPGTFELPSTAKKIPDRPKELPCPVCKKVFESDAPGGQYKDEDGTVYYFCSEDCLQEWLEERNQ